MKSRSHQRSLAFPRPGYDDHVALALGQHAYWIYRSPELYRNLCLASGYEGALIIERGSSQVGIAYAPWGIVVSSRGSSQLGDWLENFQTWRVGWKGLIDVPGVGVHRGFKRQAKRMEDEFLTLLYALLPRFPDAPVWFCGHSLGAAMAPLLALMAGKAAGLYLFDMPRTGNAAWSKWWDVAGPYGAVSQRVVLVRHGVQDLVTRIPVSACGWWHLGRPQIIRDGVRYESEAAWDAVRAQHPCRVIDSWRVLTRLTLAALIHRSGELVGELRSQVDRAPGTA